MLDTASFGTWMRQGLDLWPGGLDAARRTEYERLVEAVAGSLDSTRFWRDLPGAIRTIFAARGWLWNGIYAAVGAELHLRAAAGPPVCASLERSGGVGTSGMCFDGLLMNQTLVADDVKRWPGYVSCDAESGLQTRAGIVVPIRDANGRAIAVWDLDSVEPVFPEDPVLFDRLFATISRITDAGAALREPL